MLVLSARRPQPSFRYQIVYKAIVLHNSETTVNLELKSNCQYHLSSSYFSTTCCYLSKETF